MSMTAQEKIKMLIGEFTVKNLFLTEEVERLKAALEAEKKEKVDGDPK